MDSFDAGRSRRCCLLCCGARTLGLHGPHCARRRRTAKQPGRDGLWPYVPNMTAGSAVAIAGGFSPRAKRDRVTLTHTDASGPSRAVVLPGTPISPGDTVLVGERWF